MPTWSGAWTSLRRSSRLRGEQGRVAAMPRGGVLIYAVLIATAQARRPDRRPAAPLVDDRFMLLALDALPRQNTWRSPLRPQGLPARPRVALRGRRRRRGRPRGRRRGRCSDAQGVTDRPPEFGASPGVKKRSRSSSSETFSAAAGVLGVDLLDPAAQRQRLLGVDLRCRSPGPGSRRGLVDEDAAVRQRRRLPFAPPASEQRAHRHRDAAAGGRDVGLDELHRVVDRQPGVDDAARRVDVELMSFSGSSASRCSSCATTRLAISSSIACRRTRRARAAGASRCRTSARRGRPARMTIGTRGMVPSFPQPVRLHFGGW